MRGEVVIIKDILTLEINSGPIDSAVSLPSGDRDGDLVVFSQFKY